MALQDASRMQELQGLFATHICGTSDVGANAGHGGAEANNPVLYWDILEYSEKEKQKKIKLGSSSHEINHLLLNRYLYLLCSGTVQMLQCKSKHPNEQ